MSNWMNHPQAKILAHPLASIVPWMSDDEFADLRKSIRANGLLAGEDIVLYEGKILDGRNRYLACLHEGVEPRFRDYVGDDPAGYVLAKLTRRDLTPSTRAMVVAELALQADARTGPIKPGQKKEESQDVLRQKFGVGASSVTFAMRTIKNGVPELKRMVENGEIDVRHAGEVARLPMREQKKVVAAGPQSVIAKSRQLRRAAESPKPPPPPVPTIPDTPEQPAVAPVRRFDPQTEEILRDIRNLAAKLTRHIQTSDGKRFEQYVQLHLPGSIDYGRVKLTDKGEGLEKVNAAFTGLQPLYRLLVAAARNRAYLPKELKTMMADPAAGPLDGHTPPPEPEDDPAQLVEPESL